MYSKISRQHNELYIKTTIPRYSRSHTPKNEYEIWIAKINSTCHAGVIFNNLMIVVFDFSPETIKVRWQWQRIFKLLKAKILQILHPTVWTTVKHRIYIQQRGRRWNTDSTSNSVDDGETQNLHPTAWTTVKYRFYIQ